MAAASEIFTTPVELAGISERGATFAKVPVVTFSLRMKFADGRKVTIKGMSPQGQNPDVEFTPAVREKAIEVLQFLAGQVNTVKRKILEDRFQNGQRGGQLDKMLRCLKACHGVVSNERGFYADDVLKFRNAEQS